MKLILKEAKSEIEIKKSKFICSIKPISTELEAKDYIAEVKKEHYRATHNVPVYLLGEDYSLQRYSDDGEPSGTAGLPVLRMLMKEGISNLVLVITRYYGGIKLGKGGLVRAYTESAKSGLVAAGLSEVRELSHLEFSLDYTYQAKFDNNLLSYEHYIKSKDYGAKVDYSLYVEEDDAAKIVSYLRDLSSGEIKEIAGLKKRVIILNGELTEL